MAVNKKVSTIHIRWLDGDGALIKEEKYDVPSDGFIAKAEYITLEGNLVIDVPGLKIYGLSEEENNGS